MYGMLGTAGIVSFLNAIKMILRNVYILYKKRRWNFTKSIRPSSALGLTVLFVSWRSICFSLELFIRDEKNLLLNDRTCELHSMIVEMQNCPKPFSSLTITPTSEIRNFMQRRRKGNCHLNFVFRLFYSTA